jgi:hypothetical protein
VLDCWLIISLTIQNRFLDIKILLILILIGMDQIIQFLVVSYHDSINLTVVEDWLTIIPIKPQSERYISNAQKLPAVHLLTCFGTMVLGYVMFRFMYFFEQNRNMLVLSAFFYAAGILCSMLNTVLYNMGMIILSFTGCIFLI